MSESDKNTGNVAQWPVRWPWWLIGLYLVFLTASVVGAMAVCVRADNAGQTCLAVLSPFFRWVVDTALWIVKDPVPKATIAGEVVAGLFGLLTVAALIWKGRLGIRPAMLFLAFGIATLAQTALFAGVALTGCLLYAAAGLLILVWRFLPETLGPGTECFFPPQPKPEKPEGLTSTQYRFLVFEFLCLGAITWAAIILYLYALNHLPDDFEGEMSIYMAVSTSLEGSVKMNFGAPGLPWAPLGLGYYVLLFITERTCGTTLLAARFVSALSGILLINLLYGFLRRSVGVTTALVAAGFLALNCVSIVWSRQDFFPFAYPSLVTVALCWTTYLALEKRKTVYFFLTALLMGATYHLFASGQTGFLIPVGFLTWHLIATRGFARQCWWKMSFIIAGIALWVIGLPLCGLIATGEWQWLNPFVLNKGKTLWSLEIAEPGLFPRILFIAENVWKNVVELLHSIHIANVWPVHQTVLRGIPFHTATYLSPVTAVLVSLGALILILTPRRKISSLLISWIIVGSLTGILSNQAAARRLATIFPALFAVAGLMAAGGFNNIEFLFGKRFSVFLRVLVLGTVLPFLGFLHAGYYFVQSIDSPASVNMARAIEPYMKPNTLVIADIRYEYYTIAEISYMVMDDLNKEEEPPAWYLPEAKDWPALAVWPRANFDAWYYKYTFLQDRVDELKSKTDWDRITYIIQDVPENQRKIGYLKALYPKAEYTEEKHSPQEPWYHFVALETDYEHVERVTKPTVTFNGDSEHIPGDPGSWVHNVDVHFVPCTEAVAAETTEATLSAGLWVQEQSWEAFEVEGGGDLLDFQLDGRSASLDRQLPLTGGFHRLDVHLGKPWNLPLRLRAKPEGGEYRALTGERLVAPRVSEVTGLAAQDVVPYPGFEMPVAVANVPGGFDADFAVSPSGNIAALGVFANSWKVAVFAPDGTQIAEWTQPIPLEAKRRFCAIDFAEDNRIVVLDYHWPTIPIYDLQGTQVRELEAPGWMDQALDIAANKHGEVFVASGPNNTVLHLSPTGEVLGTWLPPEYTRDRRWRPYHLSASPEGPVAVVDDKGDIHIFATEEPPPAPRQWDRVLPPQSEVGGFPLFAIRDDGWLIVHYTPEREFRVLDEEFGRRIAHVSTHDLTRNVGHKCRQIIGFDEQGHFYVWWEARREVLRLVPRSE